MGVVNKRPSCVVCKLEQNLRKKSKVNKMVEYCTGYCSKNFLMYCRQCDVYAHTVPNKTSKFNNIIGLAGKSCFEIFHSKQGIGLNVNRV